MAAELPQEIIDRIIDEIALDPSSDTQGQARDMKALSFVSSKWQYRSRTHLFRELAITTDTFPSWCRDVRPGDDGPSRFVTYIRYKPSLLEAERNTGPLEGLACSPFHMGS